MVKARSSSCSVIFQTNYVIKMSLMWWSGDRRTNNGFRPRPRAAEPLKRLTEFDSVCNLGRFHTHRLPAALIRRSAVPATAESTAGDQREEKVN